jgi:hypothetical protein
MITFKQFLNEAKKAKHIHLGHHVADRHGLTCPECNERAAFHEREHGMDTSDAQGAAQAEHMNAFDHYWAPKGH